MNLKIMYQKDMRIPPPKSPMNEKPISFFTPEPSRNFGGFSIAPTITIKYTTIAKIGIVTMNQSNSELMYYIYATEFPEVKMRSNNKANL